MAYFSAFNIISSSFGKIGPQFPPPRKFDKIPSFSCILLIFQGLENSIGNKMVFPGLSRILFVKLPPIFLRRDEKLEFGS